MKNHDESISIEELKRELEEMRSTPGYIKAMAYYDAAAFTGTKKATVAKALECGSDRWAVVRARNGKFALYTGESLSLLGEHQERIMQYPPVDE